jgi:hypothetical protein
MYLVLSMNKVLIMHNTYVPGYLIAPKGHLQAIVESELRQCLRHGQAG